MRTFGLTTKIKNTFQPLKCGFTELHTTLTFLKIKRNGGLSFLTIPTAWGASLTTPTFSWSALTDSKASWSKPIQQKKTTFSFCSLVMHIYMFDLFTHRQGVPIWLHSKMLPKMPNSSWETLLPLSICGCHAAEVSTTWT